MSRPTQRMKQWYADPAEQERWGTSMADQGLFPTEKALIEKHFVEKGRLLNIGCGGGREALALAERFDVVAVDFSRRFCEMAQAAFKAGKWNVPVLQMDAMELAFEDETFDYVVMVGQLIGQIPGRKNRIVALSEANRVLKPGGAALISTNAIELGWRYRAYFAAVNALRRIYNPHRLEPDDAFVFRTGGQRAIFAGAGNRPVFHWYKTPRFLEDAAEAGFEFVEYLRRYEFEGRKGLTESSTTGETFYILKKPLSDG